MRSRRASRRCVGCARSRRRSDPTARALSCSHSCEVRLQLERARSPQDTHGSDLFVLTPSDATEDEDEVLVALAEELGGFVDVIGGAQHAAILVEPLEVLAGIEETVVRDRVCVLRQHG